MRMLNDMWASGKIREALAQLQRLDDLALAADIVRSGALKDTRLDLECATNLLSTLRALLDSSFEDYQRASVAATSQLSHTFGPLIRSTRSVSPDQLGVNLSAEARVKRCDAAYAQFAALAPRLQQLAEGRSPLGRPAADLLAQLKGQLDLR